MKAKEKNNNTEANSRRTFLKNSAKAAFSISIIPSYVLGGPKYTAPSDKINLGFIGVGKKGRGLLGDFAALEQSQIIAACDVDAIKLTRFQKMAEEAYARKRNKVNYKGCDGYEDFREIISRDDIDAVVIGTPDHWHSIPAIRAANAGKDIYCEKPMAHTVEEGRAMVNAVQNNNIIFQTGSQQRSTAHFRKACELVRNNYIGEIQTIKVSVGGPPYPCSLPTEEVPYYLNWDLWLGPAGERPFNSILSPPNHLDIFPDWRKYREFGGGGMADWGAHMFDIAQWGIGMDDSGPVEVYPPNTRDNNQHLTYVYKNGITMTREDFGRGNAVRFIGSQGSIDVSRSFFDPDPEELKNQQLGDDEIKLYQSDNHKANWLECIKDRKAPICDVSTGHHTATVCNIGNIAYRVEAALQWDPEQEKFNNNPDANKLLGKNMRSPWHL